MKQTKRFIAIIVCALFTMSTWAQVMTFTYADGKTATASEMADGSYLMQLPAGTDLNSAITGVKVNGTAVDATKVVPNPTETFITEGEIETFVYEGKAYSFRFIAGGYFTMVIFSDPHVDSQDTQNSISARTAAIAAMGTESGAKFTFDKAPKGFVPKADIVFCLGDLDANRDIHGKYFNPAVSVFNEKGIPFVTLIGNHDIEPDYYNDNSKGMSLTGQSATNSSLEIMTNSYTSASELTNGIENVTTITDENLKSYIKQIGQFTFTYRGIRFYCASSYWWQKPYSGTTYYSAEGTISALNTFVESHKDEPSIWLSHYPFVAEANNGEDKNERWWLDQNYPSDGSTPKSILPSGSSQYYTDAAFTTDEGKAVADLKKKTLADIIVKTNNPVHFSGHAHINAEHNYTANDNTSSFTDHTIQPFYQNWSNAFIVLCKEGVGVVEVKTVTF